MPPADQESRRFPHRSNEDGTFDSICPVCFITVANAAREEDLAAFECGHVCDPNLINVRSKRLPGIDRHPGEQASKAG
jgi:hypothetical protein